MRRHGLLALFLEALPIFGPIAYLGIFFVAYSTWTSDIPDVIALLAAASLSVLALTTLLCGLGWFVVKRPRVGWAIVLVRTLTIIAGVHALVAVDGNGCSTPLARASCAELWSSTAAFMALPLGSLVALALLEVFPRHPAAAGRS